MSQFLLLYSCMSQICNMNLCDFGLVVTTCDMTPWFCCHKLCVMQYDSSLIEMNHKWWDCICDNLIMQSCHKLWQRDWNHLFLCHNIVTMTNNKNIVNLKFFVKTYCAKKNQPWHLLLPHPHFGWCDMDNNNTTIHQTYLQTASWYQISVEITPLYSFWWIGQQV